jgi:hypothetical protein
MPQVFTCRCCQDWGKPRYGPSIGSTAEGSLYIQRESVADPTPVISPYLEASKTFLRYTHISRRRSRFNHDISSRLAFQQPLLANSTAVKLQNIHDS